MKRITLFLLISINSLLVAQEAGLYFSKSWIDNIETGNPMGYGVSFYLPVSIAGVKFEYSQSESNRSYEGQLVYGFMVPPDIVEDERIESKFIIKSYELSAAFNELIEYKKFALNLAVGGSYDNFTTKRIATTSLQSADLSETKYGFLYSISLSYKNLFNLPIKPFILFKQKFMYGTTHVTDVEQPFEGDIQLTQVQLGVYYLFNR
jgi:hypothetical protein